MRELISRSIKLSGFKCFGDEPQGFDEIKPLNLIVGRNNSGKSAILDFLGCVIGKQPTFPENFFRSNGPPSVLFGRKLESEDIEAHFDKTRRTSGHHFHNDFEFGKSYIGQMIYWRESAGHLEFHSVSRPENANLLITQFPGFDIISKKLIQRDAKVLSSYTYKRLLAERNIVPESAQPSSTTILHDGSHATNLIQNVINQKRFDRDLVEIDFLQDLKEILGTDAALTNIRCEQGEGGAWEILLDEQAKELIPLSSSGSGLKTIILVIAYMKCSAPL